MGNYRKYFIYVLLGTLVTVSSCRNDRKGENGWIYLFIYNEMILPKHIEFVGSCTLTSDQCINFYEFYTLQEAKGVCESYTGETPDADPPVPPELEDEYYVPFSTEKCYADNFVFRCMLPGEKKKEEVYYSPTFSVDDSSRIQDWCEEGEGEFSEEYDGPLKEDS